MSKNQPIDTREVEDYVIDLHKRFRFKQVSVDQWNSQSSIIRLKTAGIESIDKIQGEEKFVSYLENEPKLTEYLYNKLCNTLKK
jgi:phage terminase large subunit-like protein